MGVVVTFGEDIPVLRTELTTHSGLIAARGAPPQPYAQSYGTFMLPQSVFQGSTFLRQVGYMTLLGLGVELAGGLLKKLFK